MANVATVTNPSGFLLTRPRAESVGPFATLPTTSARGQLVHSRLQSLYDALLPPKSNFNDTAAAEVCIVGAGVGLFPGLVCPLIGGVIAAADASWVGLHEGLTVAACGWGIAAVFGAAYAFTRWRHTRALTRRADTEAPQAATLTQAFDGLSELERAVVGYRADRLLGELGDRRARSELLRTATKPMVDAFARLMPDQKVQAQRLAALIDSIMLRNGAAAPGMREDTEILTQRVETLLPEERAVVANLVRDVVQNAVLASDGHRWRLRRLLEALDGTRTPYVSEETETVSTPERLAAPNPEVTLKRCITLLEGGLAVERPATDPLHASTKIIPSTNPALAEQTAAHFEQTGYRAAIFDDGHRLVVSVFNPTHPPTGAFVCGVVS